MSIFDRDHYPEVRVEHDEDPNVVFGDDFDRRAREIQRTPPASQGFAVIPARRGPWSGQNCLGIEVPFSPDENRMQTILRLPEWDFPQVWSVMLGLRYRDEDWGGLSSDAFEITANVEAGAGGAIQEFEVDWQQGTTFSVCMNALNIVAQYRASTGTPENLRLIATVSRRKLTGRAPLRSFQLAAVLVGTQSEVIRIPNFARSVMLMNRSTVAASTLFQAGVQLQFHANPTGASNVGNVVGNELLSWAPSGVPIPPFAKYMSVENDSAVNIAPNVIFELGL